LILDTSLFLDFVLLAALSGGAVYLAMHLGARRTLRRLGEARHNETRFRDLTSLSADWFWETDAGHRTTWISGGPTVATFFGDLSTYGKRFWEIPGIEVDARALEALHERLMAQQPFFDLEMSRTDKRGARQIHIISGQSRLGEGGVFLGYRGVGRDVTEQRRAERDLSQAKERLELALGGGNLAEWDYDLASHQVYLGPGWPAFLGRESGAGVWRDADLLELVHREDRPAVKAAMGAALKGIASTYADYRVRIEGGGWRWLRAMGQVTKRDDQGRALRMSGTVADIDDHRRASEALRETEQRYRLLVELAPDAVIVHCGGIIEYANPAAARLFGATSSKRLAGLVLEEFAQPEGRERMRERLRYLEAGPGWVGFEQRRMTTLDGRDIVVDGAAVPRSHSSSAAGWWCNRCSATSPTRRARARRSPSASSAFATSPRPRANSSGRWIATGASPISRSASRRCSASPAASCSAASRATSCRLARSARCRPG
jgi:PAS domain S-box-containing protein